MFSRVRFCALLALTFAAGSLLTVQFMKNDVHAQGKRVFELRTYHALPGRLPALQARFRDHTLKLFEKHGMTNIGYWVPIDNSDNKLIYVLAFPDLAARDKAFI